VECLVIVADPAGYAETEPPQTIDYAYYDETYFYGARIGATGYRDYDRESPPYKLEFYSRAIENAVRNIDRPRVLDVGCAFGRLLAGLPPYFDRVGVDVSAYALKEARRHVPDVTFVQAEMPPVRLGTFDAITAFDVLEQVADARAMLERLSTMLAPAGEFIAVIPVYDGPLGWAQRWINNDPTRRHHLARRAWLDLIEASFDVVEWRGIFRLLSPVGLYIHAPTRALRASAPAIIVRAKRKSAV
jgi:SAM-dependent methyltransferase